MTSDLERIRNGANIVLEELQKTRWVLESQEAYAPQRTETEYLVSMFLATENKFIKELNEYLHGSEEYPTKTVHVLDRLLRIIDGYYGPTKNAIRTPHYTFENSLEELKHCISEYHKLTLTTGESEHFSKLISKLENFTTVYKDMLYSIRSATTEYVDENTRHCINYGIKLLENKNLNVGTYYKELITKNNHQRQTMIEALVALRDGFFPSHDFLLGMPLNEWENPPHKDEPEIKQILAFVKSTQTSRAQFIKTINELLEELDTDNQVKGM